MATLTNNTIARTYTGLLSVNGAISTGSVEVVEDGAGTDTALWLSTVGASLGVDDTELTLEFIAPLLVKDYFMMHQKMSLDYYLQLN